MPIIIKMDIEPTKRRFQKLEQEVQDEADIWLMEIADMGVQIMRQEAPEKTGELKSSVKAIQSGFNVSIVADAPHAVYVEKGTSAHEIVGKPVLSWIDEGGKRIWARMVQHPGTRPNPFMERTADTLKAELRDRLIQGLKTKLESVDV